MVSTHDSELCNLENDDNINVSYHFAEYENGEIKFDYNIQDGRCVTIVKIF
ncbi:MAG: hypothetical protein ACLRPW_09090 [Intestinibacter sp.]